MICYYGFDVTVCVLERKSRSTAQVRQPVIREFSAKDNAYSTVETPMPQRKEAHSKVSLSRVGVKPVAVVY
jgi:hypothetical protein